MRLFLTQILLFAFFSGIVVTPDTARAGWPWEKKQDHGMEKYSPEWWEYAASLPVGSRQHYRKGKLWPPRPRPTGPQQPYSHQYHAAHYWPTPYSEHDCSIVKVFEEAQISQGWKNATTLYSYHFDPETQELSKSGREHLIWILNNAHHARRAAFVQATTDKRVNDLRLASVHGALQEYVGHPDALPVTLEVNTQLFRPAHEVDTYQKAWIEGMIDPHIPYSVEGGGSGE